MQLYARWLTRQHGSDNPTSFFSVIGVAYVDASVHGYGIAWQACPDDTPVIIASPPHPADPWDEQAHSEASAYKRAVIFITSLGLHGRVIIVSDCLPVTVAMTKGSPSDVLQATTEEVVQIALEADLLFEPLWVPGKELVDMGVDGLSRDAILDMHNMSLSPRFFQLARDLAHQHFQDFFTIDFFASTASAVCPRYWSQFPDPDAEGTDALSAPSWCGSACECGLAHLDIACHVTKMLCPTRDLTSNGPYLPSRTDLPRMLSLTPALSSDRLPWQPSPPRPCTPKSRARSSSPRPSPT